MATKKTQKKTAGKKIERLKKPAKRKKVKTTDGRVKNGGARKGAGRKKSIDVRSIQEVRSLLEEHGLTEVAVTKKNSNEMIKKARTLLVFDKLFEKAMSGDVKASKEYLDRLLGKATQPILHEGGITTEQKLSEETVEAISKSWALFEQAAKKYGGD